MKKSSVLVAILAVVVNAEMETVSNQGSHRVPIATKNINQLPTSPKQELYYQPQLQPQYQQSQYQQPQPAQQYIPVQFLQAAPLYHNQQQQQQPQTAMIIIAQPAVVPQAQQVLYPSATQQLLNYFNANPQAKYQLLQNYQQQQQQQQQYVAQAQATNPQPALTYQIMPHSQPQYQLAHPVTQLHQAQPLPHPPAESVQPQQISVPTYQTPYQVPNFSNTGIFGPLTGLAGISTLAQLTAQKYLPPFRSPAPIITGLENFTPEQQAQIKAQLNSGGPITSLQSNALTAGNLQLPKAQQPQASQNTGPQEFTPSEQDKTTSPTQVQNTNAPYNSGVIYRNQFTKG